MFVIEYLVRTETYKKKAHPDVKNISEEFSWFQRVLGVFFWPICLTIFIISFIKAYKKRK